MTSCGSTGLEVHFPVRGGILDTLLRRPHGGRPRRRRHRPDAPPRRGPRAGRRVGERQDDDRPGRRQAHPPDGRADHVRGPGRQRRSGAGAALRDYRRRVQIIFQDPYETLEPEADDPRLRGRAARRQRARDRRGATRGAGRRRARGGRAAAGGGLRGPLSRTSCRAASASGSSSPARSSWIPSSSSPTSPCRCSTSRSGPSCCG